MTSSMDTPRLSVTQAPHKGLTLRRTFATTNAIENMNGSLRRIARNVKRWKDEKMIRRWVALGIAEAQKGFRRVKGYMSMPSLVAAIRPTAAVASEKKVA